MILQKNYIPEADAPFFLFKRHHEITVKEIRNCSAEKRPVNTLPVRFSQKEKSHSERYRQW